MGYKDLRSFLQALDDQQQLIHYTGELNPSPDVSNISRAVTNLGHDGPAVLMDNIKGYRGKRLVVGVHASRANSAVMFGQPKDATLREQFFALEQNWDRYPGEVTWVNDPPCQEHVIAGGDINLYQIMPLYRVNYLDGGCYLDKASVITRPPLAPDDFDQQNVGIYRAQVMGRNTIGLQIGNNHDAGEHYAQAEALNQPLPVALAVGVDPLLSFMAGAPLKYHESEYRFAAALGGFSYELAKALDSDLDVPANAEYVLEGYIEPHKRVVEGPFGEWPGSYSGVRNQLQMLVTKVTHRTDPIMENLYVGRSWTECDNLMALNTSVPLFKQVQADFPEVVAINAGYQYGATCIVATGQRYACYAKAVALRLASTPHGIRNCHNIILVDDSVDPFDLNQVMWALSTRVRGNADIIEIPMTPGNIINPANLTPGIGRKLIIDATTPVAPDAMRAVKMVPVDPLVETWTNTLRNMQKRLQRQQ